MTPAEVDAMPLTAYGAFLRYQNAAVKEQRAAAAKARRR